jgi:ABC-2 type transport system permease protein
MATVLQILVPLVIYFIGFGTIATDKENGTLKLLLSQGASWKEIISGKSLGLMVLSVCILVPAFLILLAGLFFSKTPWTVDGWTRLLYLLLTYVIYFAVISTTAVMISGISKKAKLALVSLIGIWLLFAIVLPRTTQSAGSYLYPSPSKIEFETAVEKDVLQQGDSHDPNDPHYKALKDSLLSVHDADSIQQLPFNYSGFQMKEGERLSAEVYNHHLDRLLRTYQRQNTISRLSAFINPFAAVKNLSMALSGTDFNSYVRFQEQAEAYRYRLAQHMNDLQIKLISNKKLAETDKPYSISRDHWKAFPDFSYQPLNQWQAIRSEALSVVALLFWSLVLIVLVSILSKNLKAV